MAPARFACLCLGAALLLAATGCATFSAKTETMRNAYGAADFARAEDAVDELIAKESGVPAKAVTASLGLDGRIDPAKGDVTLLLLEKATIRLARGDPKTAVTLYRKARDVLDKNYVSDTAGFLKKFTSLLTDDTVRDYSGADYEHILVRAMLGIADLLEGGGDAFAYAVQVGEKQEEIIGSTLGEITGQNGYKPRERYRRVGFGAFMQGIIREDMRIFDEAGRSYERALNFEGGSHPVYGPALERVRNPKPGGVPVGVVHVIEFAGRGPYLVESHENPTTDAVRLAGVLLLVLKHNLNLITQAPVPVPRVHVLDPDPAPLVVASEFGQARTETVLDVNRIEKEQNEANMPWTVARALVRRTVKAVASTVAGKAVSSGRGRDAQLVAGLVGIASSVAMTVTENADTRSWSMLPAMIRTARLELPPGVRTLWLGEREKVSVRVAAGHASYVLVVRPDPSRPPAVVVDAFSRF